MTTSIKETEYIVVTDATSVILLSTTDYQAARRLASQCRKAGGSVTIFKSIKG